MHPLYSAGFGSGKEVGVGGGGVAVGGGGGGQEEREIRKKKGVCVVCLHTILSQQHSISVQGGKNNQPINNWVHPY